MKEYNTYIINIFKKITDENPIKKFDTEYFIFDDLEKNLKNILLDLYLNDTLDKNEMYFIKFSTKDNPEDIIDHPQYWVSYREGEVNFNQK